MDVTRLDKGCLWWSQPQVLLIYNILFSRYMPSHVAAASLVLHAHDAPYNTLDIIKNRYGESHAHVLNKVQEIWPTAQLVHIQNKLWPYAVQLSDEDSCWCQLMAS